MFRFASLVALVALLAPGGVALADDSHSLIIYTAFFERRSSTFSADDIKVLEMIASLLKRDASYEMRVVAYTDPVDEDKDDEELAKARAKAVREFMTSKGVDKDRIDTKAEGDEASFGRDDSDTDRALRRRAEILKETIGSQEMSATTSRALSRSVEIKVMKVDDEGKDKEKEKKK